MEGRFKYKPQFLYEKTSYTKLYRILNRFFIILVGADTGKPHPIFQPHGSE